MICYHFGTILLLKQTVPFTERVKILSCYKGSLKISESFMVNALLLNHREVSSLDGSSGKVIASISLSRVLLSMPIAQKMDENHFCRVICFVCFFLGR